MYFCVPTERENVSTEYCLWRQISLQTVRQENYFCLEKFIQSQSLFLLHQLVCSLFSYKVDKLSHNDTQKLNSMSSIWSLVIYSVCLISGLGMIILINIIPDTKKKKGKRRKIGKILKSVQNWEKVWYCGTSKLRFEVILTEHLILISSLAWYWVLTAEG